VIHSLALGANRPAGPAVRDHRFQSLLTDHQSTLGRESARSGVVMSARLVVVHSSGREYGWVLVGTIVARASCEDLKDMPTQSRWDRPVIPAACGQSASRKGQRIDFEPRP
jgi:hypothetical protein